MTVMSRKIVKNIHSNQQGGMMILWAFVLPVIIGFVGLGVEASMWYVKRVDLQSAADAAAVAAAHYIGTGTNLTTVATNEMTRNGYTASQNLSVLAVSPPVSGSYLGNTSAVEVTVTQPEPLFFLKRFFSTSSTNIGARAVALANPAGWGSPCMEGEDSGTHADATFTGHVNLCMPGCTIGSNGTGSGSVVLKGSADLNVYNIVTVGGITNDGTATETSQVQNITGSSSFSDPFSSLTAPSAGACMGNGAPTSGAITPGTYCSNLTLNSNNTASTMSGTYIFTGHNTTFKITANTTVTGSNVLIVLLDGASIDWTGGGTVNLSAISDTSNSFHGILIYQPSSNTSTDTIAGDSNTNLTGIIYAPGGNVKYAGGTGTTPCSQGVCPCDNSTSRSCTKILADTFTFTGDASINPNCSGYSWVPTLTTPGGNAPPVVLVE